MKWTDKVCSQFINRVHGFVKQEPRCMQDNSFFHYTSSDRLLSLHLSHCLDDVTDFRHKGAVQTNMICGIKWKQRYMLCYPLKILWRLLKADLNQEIY